MGRRSGQTRDGGVRSLERGLALLVAMNRRKLPSVVELARDTRLPRPTIYRLLATLNRAGPFGSGNPEPVIALPSHQLVYADEVGQAHLRLRFKSGDGAMNAPDTMKPLADGGTPIIALPERSAPAKPAQLATPQSN